MASRTSAGRVQDEAICPICLEYLTEPVTLDCGHNFCLACITKHSETCTEGDYDPLCCPSCRAQIRRQNFQLNWQLANRVEQVKHLHVEAEREQKVNLCARHKEELKLFCEDDREAICVICRESKEHRAHTVVPIEDSAQEDKEDSSILSRHVEAKLQHQVEISAELSESLNTYNQSDALMETQGEFKDNLTTELEKKIFQSMGPDEKVNVTLDPDTAHPRLVLSEDQKSVRWGFTRQNLPNNLERFDNDPFVLGCEGFTSGRHCWEVEVGEARSWVLGVARESVSRKGRISVSPEQGFWALRRSGAGWLVAYTSPEGTHLPFADKPRRIRVSLDYERGQVTFFDVDNEALIFTFPPASFSGDKIRPFFSVGERGIYTSFSYLCGPSHITVCP
ncbi:E3 ubiquitin-protein ligase TRIM39-like [Mauremys reevesii]|uniref:E3 ubiquitin-protein ligase TRIM39-like n=1 Tax=Mauremys reevesii TaxID=260615 RepID=UPI00193F1051|nr:E3 ubiquitin-protein ligase TRIM39-like [Mauremys reevesii]XP_039402171.1 E3 ubiquitin-protein ligase TRIM39-like [Mauremys reevesii]XP_039402172.1 E3 ubiquitin-protein ligase TRIM39-like [Mauremys reevesii]XP_039402173.1 E3 ubiquitin-protein ligase TRIM39-like [Mauremys reevesii]XP_039402174.1 E3 ubiquitin-protein ligase TRIM39-like [Mauremys reevesii]XP_039402175.1 E3 ubiquitin-protein ligase TRIM39-like [Mauremys reevesii]